MLWIVIVLVLEGALNFLALKWWTRASHSRLFCGLYLVQSIVIALSYWCLPCLISMYLSLGILLIFIFLFLLDVLMKLFASMLCCTDFGATH